MQALKAAVLNLVKNEETEDAVDISKLESFYDECLAYYKEENYTKENWKQYNQALQRAKTILEDSSATQKDVDDALDALIHATAKLNTEKDTASIAPKNPSTGKENTIHTGLLISPVIWISSSITAIVAIATLVIIKIRKKRK